MAASIDAQMKIDARIAEEENAVKHLVRSNAELQAHHRATNDTDLRDAIGENIVVIARKRALLQSLYDQRREIGAAPPAPPVPPPPATAPLSATETRTDPLPTKGDDDDDGAVYL